MKIARHHRLANFNSEAATSYPQIIGSILSMLACTYVCMYASAVAPLPVVSTYMLANNNDIMEVGWIVAIKQNFYDST